MSSSATNVLSRFRQLAQERPDQPLFTFVGDDGRDAETLTFGALSRAANTVGAVLAHKHKLKPGDRAVLVHTPSLEFVRALAGCLVAGVVPVPVAPPDPSNLAYDLTRLNAMVKSSGARIILTDKMVARGRLVSRVQLRVREMFRWPQPSWPDLPWVTTHDATTTLAPPALPEPGADDVAVLQYTSGSTSSPKGVAITHGNLHHQLAMNAQVLRCSPESVVVFWVPHFHDFGLISGILAAMRGSGHLHLMSPLAFVRRPAVWFDVMSRVRATHTAAPNFAFELAVRKTTPEQRKAWNLRSLTTVMSAAEPIRHEAVRGFLDAFSASGLSPQAFCPAYGLAEHTVGVTIGGKATLQVRRDTLERGGRITPAQESTGTRMLVGCGGALPGVRVLVVDPATRRSVPELTVGEVWVDSPSKAAGYFGLEEETKETFRARVDDPADSAEYLRTGDLGFFHQGELYITGRLKDLIIVRGRNIYPEDVEDSVRHCHPLVRPGGIAAFSYDAQEADGSLQERLALLVEVRDPKLGGDDKAAVIQAVRRAVAEDHRQAVSAVLLGAPGAVPKTTSGKVQRASCRRDFLSGALERGGDVLQVARFEPEEAAPPRPEGDPRLAQVDDDFREVVTELAAFFTRMSRARGKRTFHALATTISGHFEATASGLPALPFFAAGARHAVMVRHANGVQDDDAAPDNRGATLRFMGGNLEDARLDLLLTTGECFLAGTAAEFREWMTRGPQFREAVVRQRPHVGAAAWGMFRRPDSYTSLHYYAKTANHWLADDGTRWFARFRLVPADGRADHGFVDPEGRLVPPEGAPRSANETRSRTFLHDELQASIASGGVHYLLQAQLRAGEDAEALDATRAWSSPWHDVGRLHLDTVVDPARVERLRFNPWNAPPELALPLARTTTDFASLGHLRSIVYDLAASARMGEPPPDGLRTVATPIATVPAPSPAQRRICVVGAGASGLTAARELERLGHRVTVLERAPSVAGKCASLEIDLRSYDLGGHVCTGNYVAVAALAAELGVATEEATPTRLYDVEKSRGITRVPSAALQAEVLRYQRLRRAELEGLGQPGLHHVALALAKPAKQWFAEHDLKLLGAEIAVNYTACGYGHLSEDTPALYVLKAAETAGLLGPPARRDLPAAWTIAGGFAQLWERAARSLKDLRCGVTIDSITRSVDGIRVQSADETLEFDALVIAAPLDQALAYLDASPEEQDLLGRIRTVDYFTTVVRAPGLSETGFHLLRQHCEDASTVGRAVAVHHRYPGGDVALVYSYGGPGVGADEVTRLARHDLERMGARPAEVLAQHRWRHFPQVTSTEVSSGYYQRLEALQGQANTFYLGSVFNFDLVECNVAYARDLVTRFFAPRQDVPAAVPAASPSARPGEVLAQGTSESARADHFLRYVQQLLKEELRLPGVPEPGADFLSLGLDSIKSVDIVQRLSTETGLRLSPAALFDCPTLEALAQHMAAQGTGTPTGAPSPSGAALGGANVTTELYEQYQDVVFGEIHGVGAVMDIFVPRRTRNGLAVVDVVSALWMSGRDVVDNHKMLGTYDAFCRQGFTVFAVRPGSRGRFDAQDMVRNIQAAVAWVKHSSGKYGVDAGRVGLMGGSSGGHLACLAAVGPGQDVRNSDVHALAAFCPITDVRGATLASDARRQLADELMFPGGKPAGSDDELEARLVAASPVAQVSRVPRAIRIFHGERDKLFPLQHVQGFVEALRGKGAAVELTVKDTDRHPWPEIAGDMDVAAAWMQEVLQVPTRVTTPRRSDVVHSHWFLVPRPLPRPGSRLFCFPYAGGTAEMYAEWAASLPDDVEVLALQLPGRFPRESEPDLTDMETLLDAMQAAVTPLLDVPFAFFGHSLGAVLAFELVRRLRRAGGPLPHHLMVSAFAAPSTYQSPDSISGRLASGGRVAAMSLMASSTRADFQAFNSWRYRQEAPLDVPLIAYGGANDPLVSRDELAGWAKETSDSFRMELFAGNHRYLQQHAGGVLQDLSRTLTPTVAAGGVDELVQRWRATPHALTGPWQRFDLCWIARVPSERDPGTPRFPHALQLLTTLQQADGSVGPPSAHPYADFVQALAFANTLARWNGDGRHDLAIRAAAACAVSHLERMKQPTEEHGRHFRFPGFFGRWLVPAHECEQLMGQASRLLTPEQKAALATCTSPLKKKAPPGIPEALERDSLLLHFGEYFPDDELRSSAALAHARRVTAMPGFTAAFSARYLELTGDKIAADALERALARPRDGLRPGGRLQETQFALHYLLKSGVDVKPHFDEELQYVVTTLRADGVGVEPETSVPDCDGSAVALHIFHTLGIASPMPTMQLERFWNESRGSYQSVDGNETYAVSTVLHVLQATLCAPDVTEAHKRAIWQRTISLLTNRDWTELHHISPLYIWEKIVSVLFTHEARFPDDVTRAHHDALACILARQDSSGGFRGAFPDRPTVEETALALLALQSALAAPGRLAEHARVAAAARRARAFVSSRWRQSEHPALWVGKLLYAPTHVVDAIVLASLRAPPNPTATAENPATAR